MFRHLDIYMKKYYKKKMLQKMDLLEDLKNFTFIF